MITAVWVLGSTLVTTGVFAQHDRVVRVREFFVRDLRVTEPPAVEGWSQQRNVWLPEISKRQENKRNDGEVPSYKRSKEEGAFAAELNISQRTPTQPSPSTQIFMIDVIVTTSRWCECQTIQTFVSLQPIRSDENNCTSFYVISTGTYGNLRDLSRENERLRNDLPGDDIRAAYWFIISLDNVLLMRGCCCEKNERKGQDESSWVKTCEECKNCVFVAGTQRKGLGSYVENVLRKKSVRLRVTAPTQLWPTMFCLLINAKFKILK